MEVLAEVAPVPDGAAAGCGGGQREGNRLLGVKQCAIACISNVQCANNSNVQCANNSSVNVMARTALFSFDRARMRKTSPLPAPVFAALSRCFREAVAGSALRLPTLAECQAHLATAAD